LSGEAVLENYRELIKSLDSHAAGITDIYGEHMDCRKGCDGCCRHLSVFWVEGFALFDALRKAPKARADIVRRKIAHGATSLECPLLEDHVCLLYEARPVICRTHGLPLMNEYQSGPEIHCCPKNFQNFQALPGDAVLDMEMVNSSLATINSLFVEDFFAESRKPAEERLEISEFLSSGAETWFVDKILDEA
jgi:Fe-S-cluster containining protein